MNRKLLSIALTLALTFSVLLPISAVTGVGVPNPDHIFYVTHGGIETCDPAWAYDTASGEIIQNIYEPLCAFDKLTTSNFTAKLADTWPGYGVNLGNAITPYPPAAGAPAGTNQTWYFHIRTGVPWHESAYGTVTSYDIEYSFERGMMMDHVGGPQWMLYDPLLQTYYGGSMDWDLDSDDAINETEYAALEYDVTHAVEANSTHVWFNLPGPYAPFQQILSQSWGMAVCKEYAIEHGCWTQDYGNYTEFLRIHQPGAPGPLMTPAAEMMGCGPYKIAAYNPDPHTGFWTVEKFDAYYGGWPAPGASGFATYATVKLVEEWSNRKAQFFSSDPNLQADFCVVPRPNVGEMHLGGDKDAATYAGFRLGYPLVPAVSLGSLFFNYYIQTPSDFVPLLGSTPKPDMFSDRDLRLAFMYCLNVTQFIEDYWLGEAVQPTTCMPPGRAFYNSSKPTYNIDLTKAEQHFKAAWGGSVWSDGMTVQITYNEGNTARETVANMLEDVVEHRIPWTASVDIQPTGVPWSVYIPNMFSGQLPSFTLGWLEDYPDPHNWFSPYMASAGDFSGVAQNVVYGLDPVGMAANWDPGASYGPPPYTNCLGESVIEINNTYVDHLMSVAIGALPSVREPIYNELMDIYYAEAISETIYNALTRHYERAWINGYAGTWNANPIAPGYYFYTIWKALGTGVTPQAVELSAEGSINNITQWCIDDHGKADVEIAYPYGTDMSPTPLGNVTVHRTDSNVAVLFAVVNIWLARINALGNKTYVIDETTFLGPGEDWSSEFTWDEAELNVTEGPYTLFGRVDLAGPEYAYETDYGNNEDTDGEVAAVWLLGDITNDRIVEMMDFYYASAAFGAETATPRWDDRCDIYGPGGAVTSPEYAGDGIVEMMDFFVLSAQYGTTI